jgi:hypothetical protein
MRRYKALAGLTAGLMMIATAAMAAVDFDPDTGAGFVGKGEVQEAFGWNNRQLQANADDVQFRVSSEVVTEVSWTCTNTNNQNVQERERTTTTSLQGVLDSTTRERNQVTGFILEGYDGDPTTGDPETEGPQLNSCPQGQGWSLTTPAGDAEVVSSSQTFQVSIDGEDWIDLQVDAPAEEG